MVYYQRLNLQWSRWDEKTLCRALRRAAVSAGGVRPGGFGGSADADNDGSVLHHRCRHGSGAGTAEYGRNSDGTIDNLNPKSYLGMLYKGKVSTDLDSCIYYASMVINSQKYELEPDYLNLWQNDIDSWKNEESKEIILAGVFGNGTDNYRYGQRACCLFAQTYVNQKWGIPDYTWQNPTKENTSYRNNDWGFDVFTDKLNDARFQKSFHLEFSVYAIPYSCPFPNNLLCMINPFSLCNKYLSHFHQFQLSLYLYQQNCNYNHQYQLLHH